MEGIEAIIFTAEGDMRQAINNLQSTFSGFGLVNAENVFKVCDQPHPVVIREIIEACMQTQVDGAVTKIAALWHQGFSALDIIGTLFKVVKIHEMGEYLKLEYIKVLSAGVYYCKPQLERKRLSGDRYDSHEAFGGLSDLGSAFGVDSSLGEAFHESSRLCCVNLLV